MFTSSLQYYKILKYGTSQVRHLVQGQCKTSQYPNRICCEKKTFYVICACVFCCNCTDMKPRKAQLLRLKTTKGVRVNIIESIAPVWKKIGFLMDLDPKGQEVENIEAEHALKQDDQDICCQEMFKLWLEDPNATWGNLIEILVDSDQEELAEQIKDALNL